MQIKMIETRYGSEDGFGVKRFYADKVYDVADSLASMWLRQRIAERYEGEVQP